MDKTINFNNFLEDIKSPFPDNWKIYQTISTEKNIIIVRDKNNKKFNINLNLEENKWLVKEKFISGDIFFAELKDSNIIIRQIPEVNGAIVAIDPHTGKVLALSGGFSFNLSEFNSPDLHLNHLFTFQL